jgi:hypothetical protein
MTDATHKRPTVNSALDTLLDGHYWIDTLETRRCYEQVSDDCREAMMSLVISDDGDVFLRTFLPPGESSIRLRTGIGGGTSPRVRKALLILAEAIRRDGADQGRQ